MRTSIFFAATTLLGFSAAQGLSDIPPCATSCLTDGFLNSCPTIDIACFCGKRDVIDTLSCCVSQNCNPEEQQAVINVAQGLCGPYVSDLPTQAGCTAGAAASATPAPSGAASSAASDAATTPAPTAAGNAATTTASVVVQSGNVAAHVGVGMGAVAAGLVALL